LPDRYACGSKVLDHFLLVIFALRAKMTSDKAISTALLKAKISTE